MAEEKQYQSLYRQYRPQTPGEVLGQEHVIRALMGAVREGRLAHAFLFCGPRGHRQDVDRPDPREDGQLRATARRPSRAASATQCVRIREGQHLDVVEIDAASHGGVEDARDLREKAPDRAGRGPREGLHHRRGAAALARGVRRAAEGVRGAAGRRAVRPGHDRAAQDAGDDRRPVPAVRLPPRRDGDVSPSTSRPSRRPRRRRTITAVRGARDRAAVGGVVPATRSRCWTRRACSAATTIDDDVVALAARRPVAATSSTRSADAVAVGDATGRVRAREPARAGGPGPPARDERGPRALPQPAPGEDRARPARPARRPADDEAERIRAQAAKYSRPEIARVISLLLAAQNRHALDHLAPPLARARPGPRDDPRDRPEPRRRSSPASNASSASPNLDGRRHPGWRRRAARRTRRRHRRSPLLSRAPVLRAAAHRRPAPTGTGATPRRRAKAARTAEGEGSPGGATSSPPAEPRSGEHRARSPRRRRRSPGRVAPDPTAVRAACQTPVHGRGRRGASMWRCCGARWPTVIEHLRSRGQDGAAVVPGDRDAGDVRRGDARARVPAGSRRSR